MWRHKRNPWFHNFLFLRSFLSVALTQLVLLHPGNVTAENAPLPSSLNWVSEATNHLGSWIWETNAFDKQSVRLWKAFEIPAGKVTNAVLRITVDNGYTLFLDGQELGRGSDWRTVTEYDVTQLLGPGRHRVAVEGFNDRLEGGMIFGLFIELEKLPPVEIISDSSWLVVPDKLKHWTEKRNPAADWHNVQVIGEAHHHPWEIWPFGLAAVTSLKAAELHFWQNGWFQLTLFLFLVGTGLICLWLWIRLSVQMKAQQVLKIERVRIARDIHDDLGAQLTQLLLQGEVSRREQPEGSPAGEQFAEICSRARELAHAMDEVVWAVNSRRDTVRDFVTYVCKYAQHFLGGTAIRCRLDVEPDLPEMDFDLPVRRNLFLATKEALNNAAKYSEASELFLRISRQGQKLSVIVEDNGRGFDPDATNLERNGLTNMAQRMAEIGGTCKITSGLGAGCLVMLTVPLPVGKRRWFRRAAENELAAN